jgi:predicted metal-dependent phosphoesterase TrpH
MLGDLHIHTRFSDGSYTPEQAVREAARRGLNYVSFVDHDTIDQTAELVRAARSFAAGMKTGSENQPSADSDGISAFTANNQVPLLIPGVEISAFDFARERKVHILGYGYREHATSIRSLCDPLIERRHNNTLRQIEAIRKAGYPLDENEVAEAAGGTERRLYKQHIMLVLIRKGYADQIYGNLYRELFKAGGICPWDITYVEARDAVRAILDDGGIPVLAHPGQTDTWDFLPELVETGLSGIELYHEDHGKRDYPKILEAARKYSLILTGGSDDHGDWGSNHRMGDIRAPFGSYQALKKSDASRIPAL